MNPPAARIARGRSPASPCSIGPTLMTHNPSADGERRLPPVRQRTRAVPSAIPHGDQSGPAATSGLPPKSAPKPPRQSPPTGAAAEGSHYEVGYAKPPKSSQFQAGYDPRRPRGRKPGAKNKSNTIVAMMESPTPIRTADGKVQTISTAEALARKLRELGLTGQLGAIIKAFELYFKAQPPAPLPPADGDAALPDTRTELSAADQAMLAWFEGEVAARTRSEGGA